MAKKKKPYKYLKFYHECMMTKKLPYNGLCNCDEIGGELFDVMKPTPDDIRELKLTNKPMMFWGAGSYSISINEFSPLRQTIVLFMGAMNNEL